MNDNDTTSTSYSNSGAIGNRMTIFGELTGKFELTGKATLFDCGVSSFFNICLK